MLSKYAENDGLYMRGGKAPLNPRIEGDFIPARVSNYASIYI